MYPTVVAAPMSTDSNSEPLMRGAEPGAAAERREPCDRCGRETLHEVFVHLFVESDRPENAAFSRQPYRVSVCQQCGAETLHRMNA